MRSFLGAGSAITGRGSNIRGSGSNIRGGGSNIRGGGSEIRRDPAEFNPCAAVPTTYTPYIHNYSFPNINSFFTEALFAHRLNPLSP